MKNVKTPIYSLLAWSSCVSALLAQSTGGPPGQRSVSQVATEAVTAATAESTTGGSSTARPQGAAEAPQSQEPKAPQRIVVTASGFREVELATPYTFQTLEQADLLANGFRTLPEALRFTPGVMIQKTANGHGSPYIRGFTGRQNLVMIDGIRMNNSTFRSGPVQYWNTIDAFSIDRLEVIKSQGSVLYGSDAVGGTVNVFTKSSEFRAEGDGQAFHRGSALYRFETNSLSHTVRLDASVGEVGSFGLHVGATYRDFGDIRDSELGRMPKTGYDEFDYDLRLDVALSHTATLTLAHQSVKQDGIWRTHRTIFFEPWQGTSLSSPDLARIYYQERTLSYVRVADHDQKGVVSGYTFTLSFQRQNEDFNRTRLSGGNTRMELDETKVETFGAALGLESDVAGGTLVYGIDYYRDRIDSARRDVRTDPGGNVVSDTRPVQGAVGDDAHYDLLGVYAQQRVPVREDLEITFGGRYTYAEANIGVLDDGAGNAVSASRSWDQATFNLRANYRINAEVSVFGGASQAFRAPNVDDLSGLKSSRTDQISSGSLAVDAEKYITYEIGSRYRGQDLSINTSIYYTDIRDGITSRPIGTVPGTGEVITAATNGSDGYLYGGEIEAAWHLTESYTVTGFVAYVDGEADTFLTNSLTPVREPISRLMPLTGSVGLRWQQPHRHLRL